ncbi:membrane protein insertion efficiency factor YidD [Parachitinimonas caeni]|uniref:Membrane protein insertion efficiency factor YidD n=1 Tax=Parachitinimonas caeni TaxID=3031301 RepID=A0ABT7DZ43_9NEIS|nr:membrane protein insertion efficiency factor YidD [Parachitinimonas caeni]MDK2125094.1 membrane protein insertion efficiency factor YidD [Parachitinimonas caeni]
MLRYAVLGAIVAYQRYLSPHKGFCCAYRHLTGHHSCSEYARRIVQRKGALALWVALPRQFERCRMAYATLLAMPTENKKRDKNKSPRLSGCNAGKGACECADPFLNCNHLPDVPCDAPCDCSW